MQLKPNIKKRREIGKSPTAIYKSSKDFAIIVAQSAMNTQIPEYIKINMMFETPCLIEYFVITLGIITCDGIEPENGITGVGINILEAYHYAFEKLKVLYLPRNKGKTIRFSHYIRKVEKWDPVKELMEELNVRTK